MQFHKVDKMDTKSLLKKVRTIEIKTRRLSDHIFGGEYHSKFKGRGMTFSEVRQYQYGDDVRSIDWNVTARTNEPHVKIFEEERELTMMLMVDVSGSALFGTTVQRKKDLITELAATLAFSATQNNDKIGLLMFSSQVERYVPPKKGRSHVLRIIRDLIEYEPKQKATDFKLALEFLSSVIKKKAIVFALSDFMSAEYDTAVRIAAKKHDLTGIRIYDPKEVTMPSLGLIPVLDQESEQVRYINTASKRNRMAYQKSYDEQLNYFKDTFKRAGAGTIDCAVTDNYVKKLLGYFKQRR